eukprot:6197329-Pleurochrysis_carterae.AAC.1
MHHLGVASATRASSANAFARRRAGNKYKEACTSNNQTLHTYATSPCAAMSARVIHACASTACACMGGQLCDASTRVRATQSNMSVMV